jgi:cytochrome c-type biogenesis protein CcmH/NrfG
MMSTRVVLGACFVAGLFGVIPPARADTWFLILQGKVVMSDGSVPPQSVGIERYCTDSYGSAPGPLTDKKTGQYVWRMEVDPIGQTRQCVIRATLKGYVSTAVDISGFKEQSDPHLPPIMLTPSAGDPNKLILNNDNIPSKSAAAWKAAIKAMDGQNLSEVINQLKMAVQASPKFAQGWSVLGVVYVNQNNSADARDAFEHAIVADPKLLPSYVSLARLCIQAKDWECAAKASDGLIKLDSKKDWPEIYLHQAVARYGLKDLDGAQASAEKAISLDRVHHRAEYILGRILEAKGDVAGARQHMSKYLELDPTASDAAQVKAHLDNLGKPATGAEPALEVL